jgi:Na+/melibiose symporter-like transporter
MTVSVYPAIFLVIIVVCLAFYKINRSLNLQIQDELIERRKRYDLDAPAKGGATA